MLRYAISGQIVRRVLLIILSLASTIRAGLMELNMISILPKYVPVGGSLAWAGAALDLAAESVNRKYAGVLNLSVTLLYGENDRTCVDAEANTPVHLADYYYTKAYFQCIAIMAEWDILLFANAMVPSTAINPVKARTSTGMVGSYEGLAMAVLELFRHFKWFHVTVLLDATASTDFYRNTYDATTLDSALPVPDRYPEVKREGSTFDPVNSHSLNQALRFANSRSRAFFILAHTVVAIKLLRAMKQSGINVVAGDYVFVVLQPVQQPAYGPVSLFNHPTGEDSDLFRSVLYLTTFGKAGKDSEDLNRRLIERENSTYGSTFAKDTNPLRDLYSIRETYNSVELFAALVNDSRATRRIANELEAAEAYTCSGNALKSLMLNRTFNFPSGVVYLDQNGSRHSDLLLYAFHGGSNVMRVAAHYESMLSKYIWKENSTVTIDWFDAGIPRDIPVCGFFDTANSCRQTAITSSSWLPALVALMLLVAIAAAFLVRRRYRDSGQDTWWLMELEEVGFDVRHLPLARKYQNFDAVPIHTVYYDI